MSNKPNISQRSKDNQTENRGESHEKGEGINLNKLPQILKRSILDWESTKRIQLNDKFFDGYEELFTLTGIAPQTLRKYTNMQSPEFPPVNKLFQICLTIQDNTPMEYINYYSLSFFPQEKTK